MNSKTRLLKQNENLKDESYYPGIKYEALSEITKSLSRRNFKIIESSFTNDVPKEKIFDFNVLTLPKEEIQLKTDTGLYIKISTKKI